MYLPVLNGCANTHHFLQRHYTGYTCLCPHPHILHPHSNAYTCLYHNVCYCSALTHTVHISMYNYTCLYVMAVLTPVVCPQLCFSHHYFVGVPTPILVYTHSNQSYPPPPPPPLSSIHATWSPCTSYSKVVAVWVLPPSVTFQRPGDLVPLH